MVFKQEIFALLDCLSKDHFELAGRVIIDFLQLLDQLGQGSDKRFKLLLRVEDVLDLLEVILAERLVSVLEYDLLCALLDNIVEYLSV